MLENTILTRGYLSVEEIEEIHSIFVLLDSDGSGFLTCEKLQIAIQGITRNSDISRISISSLYGQMDIDQDGRVKWNDFLGFTCRSLIQYSVIRPKLRTDLPMNSFEKEILQRSIAGIIANGYVNMQFASIHVDSLEARTETWDYLGESLEYSIIEKQQYLEQVLSKVDELYFSQMIERLNASSFEILRAGLEELKQMLCIMCCFSSSYERQGVSEYLINLFKQILSKNVLSRIVEYLDLDAYKEIQWQALSIITLIVPGPRLPNYPLESKTCVEYSKKILLQSGALLKILGLCQSECIEVRGQALLALGFITRYDNETRDYFYNNGTLGVLLGLLKKGLNKVVDVSSLVRAAWVLSIFSGATMDTKQILPLSIRQQELQSIAETVLEQFQCQDESNLLANSLISLSFVLPNLTITEYNRWILERLVQLMSHQDFIVKKAVLQTIRNVICQNADQCRILTELGLNVKIIEILAGRESHLKLDTCTILRFLIGRGYTWQILNISRLGTQLQDLIANDKETRWEAIRIIKCILDSNTKIALEDLARTGLINTIFQNLLSFRDLSQQISEIYHENCVCYNFGYLHDCLLVLDKFIISGWTTGDPKIENSFFQYFQGDQVNSILDIIRVLLQECKKGKELYQISYGEVNIDHSLTSLIEKFILAHQGFSEEKSMIIVETLSNAKAHFKNSLRGSLSLSYVIDSATLMNAVQKFIVKTMDSNNYPKGENHVIQTIRKEEFEFYAVRNQINNIYGCDKKLEYIDSKNDKISINNQEALIFALIDSSHQHYEEFIRSHQLLGKSIPNPLIIPQIEIKFLVSSIQYNGYSNYSTNYTDISSQFINHKDLLLRDLASSHGLQISELEHIHTEFCKACRGRRIDGKLNKSEFEQMMQKKINNFESINELFNAIDEYKTGLIDFRGFVTALGILRRGNQDRKLLLAFSAYSKSEIGYLSKSDTYDMILIKQKNSTFQDPWRFIERMFMVFDTDRDNKLSFDDFKHVFDNKYLSIDDYFVGLSSLSFDELLVPCQQCGKKIIPRGNLGLPSKCDDCTSPMRRSYLFS